MAKNSLFLLHQVADYLRLSFTLRCDLAHIINLLNNNINPSSKIDTESPDESSRHEIDTLWNRSFIQTISTVPLQVHYYSEALPTQHGYCARVSRRSATGNCELRTCPRSLRGGYSGSRTHDPSDERRRLYQCATHAPQSCITTTEVIVFDMSVSFPKYRAMYNIDGLTSEGSPQDETSMAMNQIP